jgi:4-azaleucine resistance transporter AzlC
MDVFTINDVSSIWRTSDRDRLRDVGLVCLAVFAIALSYGATAATLGFPWWFPVLLGTLVLAGGAELLFIGIVGAGGSVVAAVAAGLLVNARHLPYGLSVPDVVGTGWRRLVGTHVMNDESVALALAQDDSAGRRAAYWSCGLGILLCWPTGAYLGGLLGTAVPDTGAFGLDAVFPAVLFALILPAVRSGGGVMRAAVAGGTIAAVATPLLPAGLPVLVGLAGVVFALWPRSGRDWLRDRPESRR